VDFFALHKAVKGRKRPKKVNKAKVASGELFYVKRHRRRRLKRKEKVSKRAGRVLVF
jgi:hypothetical protein